ncbi:hypothetical protein ZIOFF_051062 [Zingiber officinale]|uniref:Uncharacterized protein n=1 Tax=Zingiber officinale TaxID=94328 RepID=A0A8J5KU18_ZINOF|nr:hypothetical protein ZIOFF_051062 [Zingiber officinale]
MRNGERRPAGIAMKRESKQRSGQRLDLPNQMVGRGAEEIRESDSDEEETGSHLSSADQCREEHGGRGIAMSVLLPKHQQRGRPTLGHRHRRRVVGLVAVAGGDAQRSATECISTACQLHLERISSSEELFTIVVSNVFSDILNGEWRYSETPAKQLGYG